MTAQKQSTRIPTPLYAVAGVGALAYEQLRKLPAVLNELSDKAAVTGAELRVKTEERLRTANLTAAELREKAEERLRAANLSAAVKEKKTVVDLDAEKLRELAGRNAAALAAGAQVAQERALAAYKALVAEGERAVGAGVVQAADTVNADIEVTEPATTPAAVEATPATVAEVVEAKPKAVRPRKAAPKPRATTGETATKSATGETAKPKSTAKKARPAAE
ncbi:hypothetical protein [Melissospora conviva]|uniref:hypothetical protein n=1 Tax=Melissospora conviva TaxID=3388432 RepID=UPI003C27708E